MAQNTAIPKGTRDFLPHETLRRNFIFDTIKTVFTLYGYLPIETPAMENLSTLLGKYGDEGDKLVFRILNSGDFIKNTKITEDASSAKIASEICEKGLRYDLTVPFARFVVKNQNEINFPFKRYQIQPVWRADKPQKGRYREFFQCDADVIGSDSLINEFELILVINEVFKKLNLNTTIKLNNRKILAGLIESLGESDKFSPITVTIDKIDKIGIEKTSEELKNIGVSDNAIAVLKSVFTVFSDNTSCLNYLKTILSDNPIGMKGIEETELLLKYIDNIELTTKIKVDLSLARGLNYYTGTIFEVISNDVEIGSICGGGRYDNLTEIFGLKGVSGVGISFGADRIYDVISQLGIFPEDTESVSKIMFVNFGPREESECIKLANILRQSSISSEIFPDYSKMKKQMQYADKKKVKIVAIIGEEELKNSTVTLKHMLSGNQISVKSDLIVESVRKMMI